MSLNLYFKLEYLILFWFCEKHLKCKDFKKESISFFHILANLPQNYFNSILYKEIDIDTKNFKYRK